MLAWSEGTDNGRQKTRNHGYDVIAGETFTDADHPRKLVTLNPKSINKQFNHPVGGMPAASSFSLKDFSPKSQGRWRTAGRGAWRLL